MAEVLGVSTRRLERGAELRGNMTAATAATPSTDATATTTPTNVAADEATRVDGHGRGAAHQHNPKSGVAYQYHPYVRKKRSDSTSAEAKKIMSDFMHEMCVDDNASNRKSAKVQVDANEQGEPVCVDHPPKCYPGNWRQMHDMLTGRDSTQPKGEDGLHPQVCTPHPAWGKLMDLPDDNLKYCESTLKTCGDCKCFKKSTTQKCACKRCYGMHKMILTLNHSAPQWYARSQTGVDSRTDSQKALASSADRAVFEMCCPPVELGNLLGLTQYHPQTGKPLPGPKLPWSIRAQACHLGKCNKCPGWNSVWQEHPMRSIQLPKVPGGFGKAPKVNLRCDPVLFTDDEFAYHVFQKLRRGKPQGGDSDGDETWRPGAAKAKTSELWTPVVGTRATFMALFYHTYLAWREHRWYVQYHNQHGKVELDHYGLQLAAGVAATARQRGAVFLQIDFSSRISPDRSVEITGVFQDSCNVLVMYFTHDFRMQKVSELPLGRLRSGMEHDGVEAYHTADSTIVYLYSNANNDAVYYGQGMFEALEVLAKGELGPGAVCDFIHKGSRIKGSKASGCLDVTLPANVIDRTQLVDYQPGVHTVEPLIKAPITALLKQNDGCPNQFKCKNGHRATQQLGHHLSILLGHPVYVSRTTDVPEEGKGKSDGATRVPTAAIRNARRLDINAVDSSVASRALFVEGARAAQRPSTPRLINPAFYAHTNYVHGWLPDNHTSQRFVATQGYPLSSLDFWHSPHPGNRNEHDAWLQVRHQPCFCSNCLEGYMEQCLVPDLVGDNGVRNCQLPRAADLSIVAKARAEATQAHARKIKHSTTVVARVHPDERAAGARYHLAMCLNKPFCTKPAATNTNWLKGGTVVVKMRWLYRARARDRPGLHAYELPKGDDNEVWPVENTVASCYEAAQLLTFDKQERLFYLPAAAHAQIISSGVDLLA